MKPIFPSLESNSSIKKTLGGDIARGAASHAYIIEGAYGSGKKTVAILAAAATSCEAFDDEASPLPCGKCLSCRKILGGLSPDVVRISRGDKASIGIEQIRAIRSGLYTAPNDSDMRTYVIEEADKMTVQAQNALLLTLEEPPSFVTFFLIAEDASKLLETIKSRAQILRTETLDFSAATKYLKSLPDGARLEKQDKAKFNDVIAASGGSIGVMKELLDKRSEAAGLLAARDASRNFVSMLFEKDAAGLLSYSSSLPKGNDFIRRLLTYSANAVRDLLALKSSPDANLTFYTSAEAVGKYAETLPNRRLIALHDIICDALNRIDYNVSPRTLMTELSLSACALA